MGFAAKPNLNANKERRGAMGLLLVFFPTDQNKIPNSIRRTTSTRLLTKALSTISLCALFLLLTLLLFTLSTFEPSNPSTTTIKPHPRFSSFLWFFQMREHKPLQRNKTPTGSFALQGMGTLYRRGTKAMNELVVGHVIEDVNEDDFRLFLRLLHRSGITSRADVVFLFGSSSLSSRFTSVIEEENDSFFKLIRHYNDSSGKTLRDSILTFDSTQFWKSGKKVVKETIWGKKSRGSTYSNSTEVEGESTRLTYGSVVRFDVHELDPENSLAGFLDHVPMSLRRWACYPMLLGRLRRNFKHIILLDVKNSMLLSDPLGRVRNRIPESVYISTKESNSGKHSKRNSEKTQSHHLVNSGILMGGGRGIRRLSSAMLTEIVRATMQHKKKSSISESGVLSQLVGNGHILKNVNLITSTESIQEVSSLLGLSPNSASDYSIIQRGNNNHLILKLICLIEAETSVYRDC